MPKDSMRNLEPLYQAPSCVQEATDDVDRINKELSVQVRFCDVRRMDRVLVGVAGSFLKSSIKPFYANRLRSATQIKKKTGTFTGIKPSRKQAFTRLIGSAVRNDVTADSNVELSNPPASPGAFL